MEVVAVGVLEADGLLRKGDVGIVYRRAAHLPNVRDDVVGVRSAGESNPRHPQWPHCGCDTGLNHQMRHLRVCTHGS